MLARGFVFSGLAERSSYLMKKCPHCAEQVQDEAVFCKHCKKDILKQTPTLPPSVPNFNKPLSNKTLVVIVIVIVLLCAYAVLRIKQGGTSVPATPAVTTDSNSNQPLEYKLASIEYGTTNPPQELVNQFKDQLYKLSQACPKNTEQQLSDYIVKAHDMITEKRPVFSLLEVSQGFYTSIPKNNATANCSDFMAVYMALVLKGY